MRTIGRDGIYHPGDTPARCVGADRRVQAKAAAASRPLP
jgi:hypothetical protein